MGKTAIELLSHAVVADVFVAADVTVFVFDVAVVVAVALVAVVAAVASVVFIAVLSDVALVSLVASACSCSANTQLPCTPFASKPHPDKPFADKPVSNNPVADLPFAAEAFVVDSFAELSLFADIPLADVLVNSDKVSELASLTPITLAISIRELLSPELFCKPFAHVLIPFRELVSLELLSGVFTHVCRSKGMNTGALTTSTGLFSMLSGVRKTDVKPLS